MMTYEYDPDVVRWGLHHLDVCSVSNGGPPPVTTHYDNDLSKTEYVQEGFCEAVQNNVENDAMIAHALQEELKRVSDAEVSGFSHVEGQQQQASVLAQDWQGSSSSPCRSGSKGEDNQSHQEELDSNDGYPEEAFLPEMVDEYILDGEVGKRLIQINPLPHVPRVNGQIPSVDEAASDHQRLLDRQQGMKAAKGIKHQGSKTAFKLLKHPSIVGQNDIAKAHHVELQAAETIERTSVNLKDN